MGNTGRREGRGRVALGVTGCIAAYKSALILRLLQQEGFEVLPIMTRSAQEFLGPLTLEKLSGHRVVTGLFDAASSEVEHIALARKSDLLLVAPATANILAKFAHGIADDFLSTLYVSTATPVVVAPAMNVEMWRHAATQENVELLKKRGVVVVPPAAGYQACGEYGEGRLAEPPVVVAAVLGRLGVSKSLSGKKVLVTAGPTVEDIDPVRFVSNRSSGKMGFSIAREAERRGAEVYLVSGPTHLVPPQNVEFVSVRSAVEMAKAVYALFPQMDVVVKAAAVADFTPVRVAPQKIKKGQSRWQLDFQRTEDILRELGKRKQHQFLVGFAAETENIVENAVKKLKEKSVDLIVANDISGGDSGFQVDQNEVVLIDGGGVPVTLPRMSKNETAGRIWDRVEQLMLSSQKGDGPVSV